MTPNPPENEWDKLVRSARDLGLEDEGNRETTPPRVLDRIIHLREGLWRLARMLLWRRWLLVAAGGAIALFLVVFMVMKMNPPVVPPPPLPLPPQP